MAYEDWQERYKGHIAMLLPSQAAVVSNMAEGAKTNSTTPARVVAAAGSGKTFCMVGGGVYLVNEKIMAPEDMIFTTFTKVAAIELVERFRPLLPPGVVHTEEEKRQAREGGQRQPKDRMRVGTFHSLAYKWLLRSRGQKPPHKWQLKMLMDLSLRERGARPQKDPKSAQYVTSNMLWDRIVGDWKVPGINAKGLRSVDRYKALLEDISPRDLALKIDVVRGRGFNWHDEEGAADAMRQELGALDERDGVAELYLAAWRMYDQAKKSLVGFDFADCLYHYWKYGTDKAKLVAVDEAQDNSFIQLDVARQVAERGGGRVVLTGDLRQSIYAWRGAEPAIMGEADQTIGAITLEIPENHRSGSRIVGLGNAICYDHDTGDKFDWALGGDAVSTRTADGGMFPGVVRLLPAMGAGRAALIATEIREAIDGGQQVYDKRTRQLRPVDYADFCVLCRTNGMMAALEASFLQQKLPYRIVGSSGFFDSRVARNVLAVLSLAFDSELPGLDATSSWESFRRVWSLIKRAEAGFAYMGKPHAESHWQDHFAGSSFETLRALGRSDSWVTFVKHYPNRIWEKLKPEWKASTDELLVVLDSIRQAKPHKGDPRTPFELAVGVATEYLANFASESNEGDVANDPDTVLLDVFTDMAKGHDNFLSLYEFAEASRSGKLDRKKRADLTPEQLAELEEQERNRVTVSTIHRGKGAEWSIVYVLAGAGELPHARNEGNPEEDRLFYVAVTRAREECILAWEGGESPLVTNYVRPWLNKLEAAEVAGADEPAGAPDEPDVAETAGSEAPEPEEPEPSQLDAVQGTDDPATIGDDPGEVSDEDIEAPPVSVEAPSDEPEPGSLVARFESLRAYVLAVNLAPPLGLTWERFAEFLDRYRGDIIATLAEQEAAAAVAEAPAIVPQGEQAAEAEAAVHPEIDKAQREVEAEQAAEAIEKLPPGTPPEPRVLAAPSERKPVGVTIPQTTSAPTSVARLFLGRNAVRQWFPVPRGREPTKVSLLSGAILAVEDSGRGDLEMVLYWVDPEGVLGLTRLGLITGKEYRKDPAAWNARLDEWSVYLQGLHADDPIVDLPDLRALYEITAGQPFTIDAKGFVVLSGTDQRDGRMGKEVARAVGASVLTQAKDGTYSWVTATVAA